MAISYCEEHAPTMRNNKSATAQLGAATASKLLKVIIYLTFRGPYAAYTLSAIEQSIEPSALWAYSMLQMSFVTYE
jgi:hypothetical protein